MDQTLRVACTRSRVALVGALLLALQSPSALGNGAAWRWPLPPGTPGPVRQTGLVLDKETVEFRDGKGVAVFSVRNQTGRTITTPMGFPLAVTLSAAERRQGVPDAIAAVEERRPEDLAALERSTRVEVEGKRVPIWLSAKTRDYEVVIGWRMTYPPRRTTSFTVTFPAPLAWSSGAGTFAFPEADFRDGTVVGLKYITHTGAFWARPIGEASFRFCDARLVELFQRMPAGREWTHTGWTYGDIRWTVGPAPFILDRAAGCLHWERKRWTPARGKDDLMVRVESHAPRVDLPDEARLLDRWCALYRLEYEEDPELRGQPDPQYFHQATQQLAAEHRLDRAPLDAARLASIERSAWARLRLNKHTVGLDQAPRHYRALVRLRLLEYLQSYFGGLRGQRFTSRALAACFAPLKTRPRDSLTALEQKNLRLLRAEEQKTAAELKLALAALRRAPPRRVGDLRDWSSWPTLAK